MREERERERKRERDSSNISQICNIGFMIDIAHKANNIAIVNVVKYPLKLSFASATFAHVTFLQS